MENAITFNKIQSGEYKVYLNGLELATIKKGSYTWTVYGQTDAFVNFYEKLDRYNNIFLESNTYTTKSEIKASYQSAANSIK